MFDRIFEGFAGGGPKPERIIIEATLLKLRACSKVGCCSSQQTRPGINSNPPAIEAGLRDITLDLAESAAEPSAGLAAGDRDARDAMGAEAQVRPHRQMRVAGVPAG